MIIFTTKNGHNTFECVNIYFGNNNIGFSVFRFFRFFFTMDILIFDSQRSVQLQLYYAYYCSTN